MFIIKDWKKEVFTIPNLLSLFRLALIPVYVMIYLNAGDDLSLHFVAAGVLAVSCLTDLVDGQIARRFHMISTVGKVLDPVADKATQFALIVCLSIRYPVLWAVVVLFFLKELFQLVAGIVFLRKRKMLDGALIVGKICTTVLFLSLIVMVLFPTLPNGWIYTIAATDSIFLVISFIGYYLAYFGKNVKVQDLPENNETAG